MFLFYVEKILIQHTVGFLKLLLASESIARGGCGFFKRGCASTYLSPCFYFNNTLTMNTTVSCCVVK